MGVAIVEDRLYCFGACRVVSSLMIYKLHSHFFLLSFILMGAMRFCLLRFVSMVRDKKKKSVHKVSRGQHVHSGML